MIKPRLSIKIGAREARLDGELLDLSPDEFEGLRLLAESSLQGDSYVPPEQLKVRMSPDADVDQVMESLNRKMVSAST